MRSPGEKVRRVGVLRHHGCGLGLARARTVSGLSAALGLARLPRGRSSGVALAVVSLLSCSRPQAPKSGSGVVLANSYEDSTVSSWQAEETLRIGTLTGPPTTSFGRVASLAVGPNGGLYVLDAELQLVRVFSPDGRYVRTIGRKGQGPGEFNGADGLTFDKTGHLWVWDSRNARYSAFDTLGKVVTTVRRQIKGVVLPWRGGIGDDGFMYDFGVSFVGQDQSAPYFGRAIKFKLYQVNTKSGAYRLMSTVVEHLDLLPDGLPRPLSGRLTLARDPSGYLWLANTAKYELTKTTLTGDTVLVTSVDVPARPVSRAEVDSVTGQRWGFKQERLGSDEVARYGRLIQCIIVGTDGRIFVERYAPPHTNGRVFDVFDGDGRLEAVMHAVADILPDPRPRIVGDEIYGLVQGGLDEAYVVRLRLKK